MGDTESVGLTLLNPTCH